MSDEIKKTNEEIKENTENTQEGVISDDAAEAADGGISKITVDPRYIFGKDISIDTFK